MATREENLKKINDELEIMSDEELEQVAGGGFRQTIGDDTFLMEFGYMDKKFREYSFNWVENSAKVDAGWAKAGVTCCTVFGSGDNKYWINGNQVSRKEAFAHVLRQNGYSEDAIANYDYDEWAGSF